MNARISGFSPPPEKDVSFATAPATPPTRRRKYPRHFSRPLSRSVISTPSGVYRRNNTNRAQTRFICRANKSRKVADALGAVAQIWRDVLKTHKKFPARRRLTFRGNSRYRGVGAGDTGRKRLVCVIKSLVGFPAIPRSSF